MSAPLDRLLRQQRVWRGNSTAAAADTGLATGFAPLDARLPGGGWPRGALIELLVERPGIGELALLMPVLARLSGTPGNGVASLPGDPPRWLCWVAPPLLPYAPALAAHGIALERVLLVHPEAGASDAAATDSLWAAEQALVSGQCAAVLIWSQRPVDRALRRLQLAAEAADALVVVFRPTSAAAQRSPATLRLRLDGSGTLRILKGRGIRPQQLSLAALGLTPEDEHAPRQRVR